MMMLTLRACTVVALLVVAITAVPVLAEPIPLEFVGGGSSASPVIDAVDAYTGMSGSGWATDWKNAKTNSSLVTKVMTSADTGYEELGNDEYLNCVIATSAGKTNGIASIARSYAYDATTNPLGQDVTEDHKISFKFRVDEVDLLDFTDTTYDTFQIFDHSGLKSNTDASARWLIGVNAVDLGGGVNGPGTWVAKGGDYANNSVKLDTGITLQADVIYNFEVTLRWDPSDAVHMHWDLKLDDGTTFFDSRDTYSEGMKWRNNTVQYAGGYVHFNARGNAANESREFSVDSIKVTAVPEPSSLLLLLAALATLLVRRKR